MWDIGGGRGLLFVDWFFYALGLVTLFGLAVVSLGALVRRRAIVSPRAIAGLAGAVGIVGTLAYGLLAFPSAGAMGVAFLALFAIPISFAIVLVGGAYFFFGSDGRRRERLAVVLGGFALWALVWVFHLHG